MESLEGVSHILAEILQARGELFLTNDTPASVLRGPAECAELTSGADITNACSSAEHFLEAAWRVLERDLCGWEGVEGWVSGKDAEMEFGVQMCVRVHSCERKDQKSRKTCHSLISAAGSSDASMTC